MRGLKIAALVAVSLLLVMILFLGYLFMVAEVRVTSIQVQGVNAAQDEAAFEVLKQSVIDETFLGTLYLKPTEWKTASEYANLTYTVRIRNDCLVPIDMVEIQVVPQPEDVLRIADLTPHAISAKSEADLQATILSSKDTHTVREIIVTYYVWGTSFSLKTTAK